MSELIVNAALVPVIVGVVEAIKIGFALNKKWIPLVSIVLGILGVGLIGDFSSTTVLMGIVTGLASCGLYSSGKAMAS